MERFPRIDQADVSRNQKPLNYEIETQVPRVRGLKAFSRNQKPLNYEIETMPQVLRYLFR